MIREVNTSGTRSLRQLFDELVWTHFVADVQLEEPAVAQSVRNSSLGHEPLLEYYSTHNEGVTQYKAWNEKQAKAQQVKRVNNFEITKWGKSE